MTSTYSSPPRIIVDYTSSPPQQQSTSSSTASKTTTTTTSGVASQTVYRVPSNFVYSVRIFLTHFKSHFQSQVYVQNENENERNSVNLNNTSSDLKNHIFVHDRSQQQIYHNNRNGAEEFSTQHEFVSNENGEIKVNFFYKLLIKLLCKKKKFSLDFIFLYMHVLQFYIICHFIENFMM